MGNFRIIIVDKDKKWAVHTFGFTLISLRIHDIEQTKYLDRLSKIFCEFFGFIKV